MTQILPAARRTRRPDGPPAGILALLTFAFTVASVIAYANRSDHWRGIAVFAASVPLGIYAATVYARLVRLGVRVAGPNISFFGGITASILGAASGLISWTQGREHALPSALNQLLTDLAFALGGVGMVGGLGLLIAGIAVPSVILRLVPSWLAWIGIALAVIGEVSFVTMIWSGFDVLLPITRFLGLIWLAAVGFLLPSNRHDVPAR